MILTAHEFWRGAGILRDQGKKYEGDCPSAVKNPSQRKSIRDGVFFRPYPVDMRCPDRELIFRTLERYLKGLHKEGIIKSRLGYVMRITECVGLVHPRYCEAAPSI
jgi:hypothetical protein